LTCRKTKRLARVIGMLSLTIGCAKLQIEFV
jgi:hypothetical protein